MMGAGRGAYMARADSDSDDIWEVYTGTFKTMEVISEGQKAPLGFDLRSKRQKAWDGRRKADKR